MKLKCKLANFLRRMADSLSPLINPGYSIHYTTQEIERISFRKLVRNGSDIPWSFVEDSLRMEAAYRIGQELIRSGFIKLKAEEVGSEEKERLCRADLHVIKPPLYDTD